MAKAFLISFFILMATLAAVAQTSRETGKDRPTTEPDHSATYSGAKTKKKKLDKSYTKSFDQKIEEYHKRMEANAKEDARVAREMQKPQYSDPSYFGHKKPPKKRPARKRKFCKECGMVH